MRFEDRFLDEVKSRLRLSDVIGRTVRLKRAGREWVGLSPFGKEKTPSFYVNDEKGFFHDFSSGKHGDLIGWLQDTQRLSFREAVESLAAEAGVPLPAVDPRDQARETVRAGLSDWLEEAARWFEGQLRRPVADAARVYLTGRGLPDSDWGRFRLGFAPAGRTGLKDQLIAKGALPGDLVEAGLLIAPEGGGSPYDRFRDRIIFPIADARGRVISFGGRAMNPEERAKYLNGPETELFHKGRHLYGLQDARRLLAEGSRGGAEPPLVVVEGYMDVIACQRAGVAAVAAMGTALTEDQMGLLWRSHPEPTLCFDGDAAGQRAAWKSLDRALPLLQPGRSFQFALLSGGKDPDDLLRDAGPAALKAAIADTRPFVQVLFEREAETAAPLDTPERRAGLKAALRRLAALIADKDLSQAYREELLRRFESLWRVETPVATRADAARALSAGRRPRGSRPARLEGITAEGRLGARALSEQLRTFPAAVALGAVKHPDWIDAHIELLGAQGFGDGQLGALARALVDLRFADPDADAETVHARLAGRGFEPLLDRIAAAARRDRLGAPFLDPAADPATARQLWSQAYDVAVRLAALERAVAAAKDDLERDADASAFLRLKAERDALHRAAASGGVFGARPN